MAVAVFSLMGVGLEAAHGLKLGFYLDVANETRRLMWTLAHAHGTLLGLVHIAFAFSVDKFDLSHKAKRRCSAASIFALVVLPGGFFVSGWTVYGGDPGRAIVVVPLGALALIWTCFRLAVSPMVSGESRHD